MVDVWQVAIGSDPRAAPPAPSHKPGPVELVEKADAIAIRGPGFSATVNAKTGMLHATGENGKPSLTAGPELLLLALNKDQCGGTQMSGKEKDIPIWSDCCHDWTAASVKAKKTAAGVEVQVEGAYAEAAGSYTLLFGEDRIVTVHYAFHVSEQGQCEPRQIGLVFTAPADCDTLSWRRKAFWSSYPDDHIGRPQGTAAAFAKDVPLSGLAGPRTQPTWSWSLDGNKYGSNDFRSTKLNIFEASLRSAGGNGLRVLSDASQHMRTWVDGDQVRLLVADYASEGAAPFFNEHVTPRRHLHAEDVVEGTVRLRNSMNLPSPGTDRRLVGQRQGVRAAEFSPLSFRERGRG